MSRHFFDTEIYCRQGEGYDELRRWLLVKSQGEGGVAGNGDVGGVSKEPLLERSRVDHVLLTEGSVREPLWGALLSVVKVSAPWGWGMDVAAVTHDGVFHDEMGRHARVSMLGFEGDFRYVEFAGYTAVALPCGVRDEMQLVLVAASLGSEGGAGLSLGKMPLADITSAIAGASHQDLCVQVPAFEINALCDLTRCGGVCLRAMAASASHES